MTPEEFESVAERILRPDPEPDVIYHGESGLVFFLYRCRNEASNRNPALAEIPEHRGQAVNHE